MIVAALVLLFIIRLRFPANTSIATILTRRYGLPILSNYRSAERLDYKLRKTRLDLQFLTTCLHQNLTPSFLHFKVYNRQIASSRLYRNCQKRFLNNEIKDKQSQLRNLTAKLNTAILSLKSSVSWIDFNHLNSLIQTCNGKTLSRVSFVHQRKLSKLGYVKPDTTLIEKAIFNLSSRRLTHDEKCVLAKGLKFSFPSWKPKFLPHFLPFEQLFKRLSRHSFFQSKGKTLDFFKNSLRHIAVSSFYSYNSFNHSLCDEEKKALKELKEDENIVITRPDKGNGVVILNKNDYINKMSSILDDNAKFEKVNEEMFPLILKHEDKVNNFLRTLKSKGVLDQDMYSHLFVSGAKPGIMYGLPKVHKPYCPLRPILSAISTFNYDLAKFLVPILSPITTNCFTVKDSFSFAKEICDFNYSNCSMASFDIKSLFTNIPLNETIDICTDNIFKDSNLVHGFNKSQFHKLLSLAAKDCLFIFNNSLFKQKDGVAMGNPLGPCLANAFLSHHESNWLNNCPLQFKPVIYRRYIDDIFLTFQSPSHIPLFLDYLNKQHNNIQFTAELENDNKLPFLDITIEKRENSFITSVYRKPTFTGLMTKFDSFIPIQYKRNLVLSLVTRAYKICSTYFNIHNELQFIKNTLNSNGFPTVFVEKCIGRQLCRMRCPPSPITTVNKAKIYVTIPFLGNQSFALRNRIKNLIQEFFPQVSLKLTFKAQFTLGNIFKFKDRVPSVLQSSVVYLYKCSSCNATYVGQTKRQLKTRIAEHKGLSYRTNRPISKPCFSAIRDHSEASDHPINSQDFSPLFTSTDDMTRLTAESLLTYHLRPSLGTHDSSTPLLCF